MTDNNKLAHSFERPLSFFAYEKQKIKKFYEFIQGYKIKSQNKNHTEEERLNQIHLHIPKVQHGSYK